MEAAHSERGRSHGQHDLEGNTHHAGHPVVLGAGDAFGQRPVLAQIHASAVRLRYGHGEQIQGLRQVSGNHLQPGVPVHLHLHHPHHLHRLLSQSGDRSAPCCPGYPR